MDSESQHLDKSQLSALKELLKKDNIDEAIYLLKLTQTKGTDFDINRSLHEHGYTLFHFTCWFTK